MTVNDVILTLVSTSLRNYLDSRDELPELSLRTGIPVSLRTEEDDDFSNRVTQVPVTLATNIDDPVERLMAIHSECEDAKELARGGETGTIEFMQILPPLLVAAMMVATSPRQTTQLIGSNLIVSNVRGSDQPMYIAGARMETMYPMSIITSGLGLNFTCVSYNQHVDVGITIEPHLVPEPWSIIDGLEQALHEYLRLARKAARSGRASRRRATK